MKEGRILFKTNNPTAPLQEGVSYEYHLLAIGLALIVMIYGGGKASLDPVIHAQVDRQRNAAVNATSSADFKTLPTTFESFDRTFKRMKTGGRETPHR